MNDFDKKFDEDPLLFIGHYGPAYMDKIKKYYGV